MTARHLASGCTESGLRRLLDEVTRAAGHVREVPGLLRRGDGTDVSVEVILQWVDGPTAEGWFVATVRGVIDRTAAEARLRAAEQHLLLEDRERIAMDLHDRVIPQLFGTGLGLEGLRGRLKDPRLQARLGEAIGELDTVIRDIRTVIFELRQRPFRPDAPAGVDPDARSGRLPLAGVRTAGALRRAAGHGHHRSGTRTPAVGASRVAGQRRPPCRGVPRVGRGRGQRPTACRGQRRRGGPAEIDDQRRQRTEQHGRPGRHTRRHLRGRIPSAGRHPSALVRAPSGSATRRQPGHGRNAARKRRRDEQEHDGTKAPDHRSMQHPESARCSGPRRRARDTPDPTDTPGGPPCPPSPTKTPPSRRPRPGTTSPTTPSRTRSSTGSWGPPSPSSSTSTGLMPRPPS